VSARVPRRIDTVVHELEDEGQAVVYDAEGNQLIVLNGVGAAVWFLVDGERTVGDIAREIVSTLDANRDDVERDVAVFLASLEERGLVEYR
jgi:hypothetical protein